MRSISAILHWEEVRWDTLNVILDLHDDNPEGMELLRETIKSYAGKHPAPLFTLICCQSTVQTHRHIYKVCVALKRPGPTTSN